MTATFSIRHGFKAGRVLQHENADDDLRVDLWNGVYLWYQRLNESSESRYDGDAWAWSVLTGFLKRPADEVQDNEEYHLCLRVKPYILEQSQWFELYDLLEYLASITSTKRLFERYFNSILEKDCSAYRLAADRVVPIVDKVQLEQIDQALAASKPMSTHLEEALRHLSNRKSPDYRSSIKESISAVEATCQAISHDPKATLAGALKKIPGDVHLHSAFISALDKLYGWSSDAEGIRHALHDDSKLTAEDAVFMVSICSAFVNYLLEKARRAGMQIAGTQ